MNETKVKKKFHSTHILIYCLLQWCSVNHFNKESRFNPCRNFKYLPTVNGCSFMILQSCNQHSAFGPHLWQFKTSNNI
ncbi:hypothetical protein C0J52_16311 [Blattella germanica]|nr:hypothetical protein C0J52_16311 [Blattella germanica]